MFPELTASFFLLAVTVTVHAVGLSAILAPVRLAALTDTRFWSVTRVLVRIAWSLVVLHLVEIAVWALFYWWQECMPDMESSFYFSGVTYTTVGYGDLVLPKGWRLLGAVEGLTGILMCGLSTGLFFAVVSSIYSPRIEAFVDRRPPD